VDVKIYEEKGDIFIAKLKFLWYNKKSWQW